ncbi:MULTISPECIES: adenosylcobinamide-GDP ribazoletransferase [unclassified Dyella]|uniref:adenosylcobinamide-GDP ribazoletransferase n=1 Tax=unclassified Dyella TaxID=2634549 RepID=UPI000C867609|nr:MULTISPECIES: adenosylcobinamide-GDP ribazoletransferase [unclassified Dyella]MDR3445124.1 adenosylcobinamide-GDP ribazoletransferase [Dyella sp.]
MMRGLFAAIGFLTRVPVPARVFDGTASPSAQLAWYPVVGLLIGGVLWCLGWLLSGAPPLLAAGLLLAAWVVLTGALHLDGLADSADAWVGGLGDRERTLTIMKDPRSGPIGVTAVVLVLLLKFAALASLPHPSAALWLAPLLGRAALTLAFMTTPYVRSGGLGSGLVGESRGACTLAVLLTGVCCLLAGWLGLRALIVAGVVFTWWRWACWRRLGGMTGDTCGALAELSEMAVLVALAL